MLTEVALTATVEVFWSASGVGRVKKAFVWNGHCWLLRCLCLWVVPISFFLLCKSLSTHQSSGARAFLRKGKIPAVFYSKEQPPVWVEGWPCPEESRGTRCHALPGAHILPDHTLGTRNSQEVSRVYITTSLCPSSKIIQWLLNER